MSIINYNQFRELLSKYSNFDRKTLLALYDEFGKSYVDNFFERYYRSLEEKELEEFLNKYSAYLEQKEQDEIEKTEKELENEKSDKNVGDLISTLIETATNYPLMSKEEEIEHGTNLNKGKANLNIIKKQDKEVKLYPKLEIEKILLSVKSAYNLELLINLKKLPYLLNDESILKDDIEIIRKYLKSFKNSIPSLDDLKQKFPELCFDNTTIILEKELEEQLELLTKYIIAKFNFYNKNLRLVISIAKRYGHSKFPLSDAIQEGNIGLIRAINRFDIEKGCKFSTYATWWIKQNITREISDTGEIIRIPVHMVEKIRKYESFVSDYLIQNEIEPSVTKCAIELGVSNEEMLRIKSASRSVISLETPINEKETDDLYDFVISEEESLEDKAIEKNLFYNVLSIMEENLTPREISIIFDRVGYNEENRELTLEEIGKKLGVTRERIRQIEAKSFRKLKNKTK